MRTFAIICTNDGVDIVENILKWLPQDSNKLVFLRESMRGGEIASKLLETTKETHVELRSYEDSLRFHPTKLKNFVINTLFAEKNGGFVHVLEDTVQIFSSPDAFLVEIEKMMTVFGLKSWFNTSCDICNYVYNKYNPRLYIAIDEPEAKKHYDKTIAWCSNANTIWVCYNMDAATPDDLRFDEKFRFPMYFIIEFLARRRNNKKPGELYYMNYYPSVQEELNVFKTVDVESYMKFSDDEIKTEGMLFSEMKVDNHPDSNIDVLMEDMRSKIMNF